MLRFLLKRTEITKYYCKILFEELNFKQKYVVNNIYYKRCMIKYLFKKYDIYIYNLIIF